MSAEISQEMAQIILSAITAAQNSRDTSVKFSSELDDAFEFIAQFL